MIGINYLHLFIGNTFVGRLAGFLETMPGRDSWALHAALVASAGVLLLGCRLAFGKLLAPDGGLAESTPPAKPAVRATNPRARHDPW